MLSARQSLQNSCAGLQSDVRPIRIMIVDDDDADVYAIKKHLSAIDGIDPDILVEKSDASARQKLQTTNVDICFVDFWLGSDTSIKFILKLLSQDDVKIVLVTGMGSDAVRELGLSAGATEYLDKNNINRQSVFEIVNRLCA